MDKVKGKISEGLSFIISDFLRHRTIHVDIEGTSSDKRTLNIGCVQGSSLGPRLFTTYVGDIKTAINADHYTSYADDSYVVVKATSLEEAIAKVKVCGLSEKTRTSSQ